MPSPLQFQRDMNHCRGLAHACQALFSTIQHPQGEEKVSGSCNKTTGPATIPTPTTDLAATLTPATMWPLQPLRETLWPLQPVTCPVATPTPAIGIAAGPENQSMMVCHPYTQYKIMRAKVSSLSKEKSY